MNDPRDAYRRDAAIRRWVEHVLLTSLAETRGGPGEMWQTRTDLVARFAAELAGFAALCGPAAASAAVHRATQLLTAVEYAAAGIDIAEHEPPAFNPDSRDSEPPGESEGAPRPAAACPVFDLAGRRKNSP